MPVKSFHEGYINLGGTTLRISFQVPATDATNTLVKDAAFVAALAQKAHIKYQPVRGNPFQMHGCVEYDGYSVSEVDFIVPKPTDEKSEVSHRDAAFLAALAQRVDMNYLEIGRDDDPSDDGSQRTIRVAVLSEDSNGAPEIVSYEIQCSGEDYNNGYHYRMAKNLARKQGFEPKFAFDEFDPAWHSASQLGGKLATDEPALFPALFIPY